MFKIDFHENGKLKSIKVGWKLIASALAIIGAFITGLFTTISKLFLILSIAIQGLKTDPESFEIEH